MLLYTLIQLSLLTVTQLKAIAKSYNLKGFSTLKKSNLVEFIHHNRPNYSLSPIAYMFNDNLNMLSIVHLDLSLSINSLVSIIREHTANKRFSCQVSNEKECKVLYRAGFRMRGHETLTEAATLEMLKSERSIHMTANTTKYNLINEVVEPVQVETSEQMEHVPNYETIKVSRDNGKTWTIETIDTRQVNSNKSVLKVGDMIERNGIKYEIRLFKEIPEEHKNNKCFDVFEKYQGLLCASTIIENEEKEEEESDTTNEPTEQSTQEIDNSLFWYAYTLRGFSLGCQPNGHITHNDNIGKHGIVGYDRLLSEQEMNDFELVVYSLPEQQNTLTNDSRQPEGYIVYNRFFHSYDSAYQYCLDCDFDPETMIIEGNDYIPSSVPSNALQVNLQHFANSDQQTILSGQSSTCGTIIKACDISYLVNGEYTEKTFIIFDQLEKYVQSNSIHSYDITKIYYVNKEGFNTKQPNDSIVYIENEPNPIDANIIVKSHNIIGTNIHVYSAYEPYTDHNTFTHIDNARFGQVGTNDINLDLSQFPYGSYERIDAVKRHYNQHYTRAYKAILSAHPELLKINYTCSMDSIEVVK